MQFNHTRVTDYLSRRFKDYNVSFQQRPDGGVVLELTCNGEQLFRYVVGYEEQVDVHQLNNIVDKIYRELALLGGPIGIHQVDWVKKRAGLPTFFPGHGYRERKVVKAGSKLRARVQR